MARYSTRKKSGYRGKRGYASSGRRRGYSKMARRAGRRMKFAMVGYARNVEKKYFDKTYQSSNSEALTGNTGVNATSRGVTFISNTWGDYSFGAQAAAAVISNDMLKGVTTGTTARTRVGNKLRAAYIKGAFTFTAALTDGPTTKGQGGESLNVLLATPAQPYLRTTFRMVLVKDLQVNSGDAQVTWQQVFDTTNLQAGVHSELNVDNMGRFIVLEDKIFTLDAAQPQKTCPFSVRGSSIGSVRYNGPSATALTDKGIYVVWAAFVMGVDGVPLTAMDLPSPVGHSRLCFTDE